MLSISIRPERHSHGLIESHKEFVVNLPSAKQVKAVDYCGVKSGRDTNKWALSGLRPYPSIKIKTPQIQECPVSLECVVKNQVKLGSHDCFMAEIVSVSVNQSFIDSTGYFDMQEANLLAYSHGHYYELGKSLGHFGFSIRKKRSSKKRHPRES
jgi:flavin reductase (DIM6/NTAB) family NADH-FMN oxidoreductase RutF